MTQLKRICGIGATVFLILLHMALLTHALASPRVASLAIDFPIAQNEIPNVLVPSTIPSAEPSLPTASPTPQPATVSTTNGTAPISTGRNFDFGKVIGSISPYFIIALIPLLFVIGALFYFFFMGDQDRVATSDEKEADVQFIDADESTGWRELK